MMHNSRTVDQSDSDDDEEESIVRAELDIAEGAERWLPRRFTKARSLQAPVFVASPTNYGAAYRDITGDLPISPPLTPYTQK